MIYHTPGRVETPLPGEPADLASLWSHSGRPVCLSGHIPLPFILLTDETLRTDALAHTVVCLLCVQDNHP